MRVWTQMAGLGMPPLERDEPMPSAPPRAAATAPAAATPAAAAATPSPGAAATAPPASASAAPLAAPAAAIANVSSKLSRAEIEAAADELRALEQAIAGDTKVARRAFDLCTLLIDSYGSAAASIKDKVLWFRRRAEAAESIARVDQKIICPVPSRPHGGGGGGGRPLRWIERAIEDWQEVALVEKTGPRPGEYLHALYSASRLAESDREYASTSSTQPL